MGPVHSQVVLPEEAALAALLKPGHPRLLLTDTSLAGLKQRIAGDSLSAAWYASIKASADALLSEPASKYASGLLGVSRRVKTRIYILALVHSVEGGALYLERAWAELSAAAAFPDWNPGHFLDVGEMTHAFAIGYDWFYGAWTPQRRQTLRKALLDKGLKPAQDRYKSKTDFVARNNNWNHVCNGGILTGALAILDEDSAGIARYDLHQALKSMDETGAMDLWGPDGAWDEGPTYWDYAMQYTSVAFAATQTALGSTFGFEKKPGLSQAGYFPIYMTSPLKRYFNFADAGENVETENAAGAGMYWLARTFDNPDFARFQREVRGTADVRSLLWLSKGGKGPVETGLPLDRLFRRVEVATLRSAWDEPEAAWIGFKAGMASDPHGHMDLGGFVLDALGVRWAGDMGGEDYNLPDYWDYNGTRWTYYRMRAEGHNVLIFNPTWSPQQNPHVRTTIIRKRTLTQEGAAVADLAPAYAGKVSKYLRGVALFQDRKWFLIQDDVEGAGSAEAWWFMHSRTQVQVQSDSLTAVFTQNGKRLWARILSPETAKFTVLEAKPLPGTPNPPGQKSNTDWSKLAIHLNGVTDLRLAVLFIPLAEGQPPPLELPRVRSLTDTTWPVGSKVSGTLSPVRPGPGGVFWKVTRGRLELDLPAGMAYEAIVHGLDGKVKTRFRSAGGKTVGPRLPAGYYFLSLRTDTGVTQSARVAIPPSF
ncbi:MAG TPA: heparinase II/III family protein [Fibrobacteria bacterium]|nr:heparinase II/III family protein [Fibrobacteria bacterium]